MTKPEAEKVEGLVGMWLPGWTTEISAPSALRFPRNTFYVIATLPDGAGKEFIGGKRKLVQILEVYCDMSEESAEYYAGLAIK